MTQDYDMTHAIVLAKQTAHNLALQEAELDTRLKNLSPRANSDDRWRLLRRLDTVRKQRLMAEEQYRTLTERLKATPLQEVEMPAIFVQCHLHSEGTPKLFAAAVRWLDEQHSQLAALCPHCITEGAKLREEKGIEMVSADANGKTSEDAPAPPPA